MLIKHTQQLLAHQSMQLVLTSLHYNSVSLCHSKSIEGLMLGFIIIDSKPLSLPPLNHLADVCQVKLSRKSLPSFYISAQKLSRVPYIRKMSELLRLETLHVA